MPRIDEQALQIVAMVGSGDVYRYITEAKTGAVPGNHVGEDPIQYALTELHFAMLRRSDKLPTWVAEARSAALSPPARSL